MDLNNSTVPSFAPAITDDSNLALLNQTGTVDASDVLQTAASDQVKAAYMCAVRSVKDVDYMSGKKAELVLATSKWMEILSIDWRCSSVGEQVSADLQQDSTGELAEQTLKSVFGVKSPSTILKRASSLRQYISWFQKECIKHDRYVSPFPLTEPDVWQYFLHLRQLRRNNNRGFTVSSTFLETVRFCKFVLGLYWCDTILASKRLLGFSAVEKREKGPLNQAPSLELEHLLQLHNILQSGENDIDRIGAGAFLCTIYARARWSDMRFIHHIKYDGFQRNSTMDLYTSEHKTSSIGLRREQFLPLVVPSEGVVQGDWIGAFVELCHRHGFDWNRVPYGPLLPAPKAGGGWCARPVSTSEAAAWLRQLLSGCKNVDSIRAHSMKVTLCIWAARAGFSKEHRATLSHHATALHGSDIVYSRDLQTGAIRKLQMLLKKIRLGINPVAEDSRVQQVTARFDAAHDSVVRTPVLMPHAPVTPLPAVLGDKAPGTPLPAAGPTGESLHGGPGVSGYTVAQGSNSLQCKDEPEFADACVAASVELHPFGGDMHELGLVQIDSSSGSDSGSGSSTDSDSSTGEHVANSVPRPACTEHVPDELSYHVHKKSHILHKCKRGELTTLCKTKLNRNFSECDRVIYFKYPKCMRCFVTDNNRIKSQDDLLAHFDAASKRRKSVEH